MPHAQPAPERERLDGRTLRAAYTRDHIIEAVRIFAAKGNYRPRVVDVAGVAGVATRSIFQHWPSPGGMQSLYADALTDERARAIADRLRQLSDRDLAVAFVSGVLPVAPRS